MTRDNGTVNLTGGFINKINNLLGPGGALSSGSLTTSSTPERIKKSTFGAYYTMGAKGRISSMMSVVSKEGGNEDYGKERGRKGAEKITLKISNDSCNTGMKQKVLDDIASRKPFSQDSDGDRILEYIGKSKRDKPAKTTVKTTENEYEVKGAQVDISEIIDTNLPIKSESIFNFNYFCPDEDGTAKAPIDKANKKMEKDFKKEKKSAKNRGENRGEKRGERSKKASTRESRGVDQFMSQKYILSYDCDLSLSSATPSILRSESSASESDKKEGFVSKLDASREEAETTSRDSYC